jgi:hypothetical protein
MSCLCPKVEPHVKVPLDSSCNCCDGSKFSFFCCSTRPKSPTPVPKVDQETQEIAIPVFHPDKSNNVDSR